MITLESLNTFKSKMARLLCFYEMSLLFCFPVGDSWKHLLIWTELQRSLDLLFQNRNPIVPPLFITKKEKWSEIFYTASLQTSKSRLNFSASEMVQRSRHRMQPRRKDIKKGQKEKIDFKSIL